MKEKWIFLSEERRVRASKVDYYGLAGNILVVGQDNMISHSRDFDTHDEAKAALKVLDDYFL